MAACYRGRRLREKRVMKFDVSLIVGEKTIVEHGSFKLLKDTTAKLNGYARPSSIKRTRKRQIEKARRMMHWCQETLTSIKTGKTFGTIRRENGGIRVESKDC